MRRQQRIQCPQCGFEGWGQARGWCTTCYQYWARTGRPRPRTLDEPRICASCPRRVVHTGAASCGYGLCTACYSLYYRLTRGTTRTPRPYHRERAARAIAHVMRVKAERRSA